MNQYTHSLKTTKLFPEPTRRSQICLRAKLVLILAAVITVLPFSRAAVVTDISYFCHSFSCFFYLIPIYKDERTHVAGNVLKQRKKNTAVNGLKKQTKKSNWAVTSMVVIFR